MNGITYYRLKSDYSGDYTKNCALNGTEVDNNFYVLEGRDVKTIAADGTDIAVTLMNGDVVKGRGVLDFVKPSEFKSSVVKVEFDKLNGILKLTTADGNVQNIEGFATNENTNFSVATDSTLCGDGLRNAPLGVAPSARTGQYKTVKAIINVAEGEVLPTCGNLPGDRYVTCEDISDYGYLYDYNAIRKIACELKHSGWRIPTKEDWDSLLNAVEPCDCDKNHDKCDKNKFLGRWAGKLLKSKTMWLDCCCDDCDHERHHHHDCDCDHEHHHHHEGHHHHDYDCYDCDCDHEHHHHHEEHHHHDDCNDSVCFDYSDNHCIGTKECEHNCKCEKDHCHKGLDSYGFRVTPAGYADDGCNYSYFKERGAFWTATTDAHQTKAYIKRFQHNKDGVYQDVIAGNFHLSLRLVKDYNGKNFFEAEEIMDMEYPTLLLPSATKGRMIWTACNFACGNASLNPMLPNNGQHLTYTRHFFINEWNGFKWVRNEIKQGETVTVAKAPKGKQMIEYRVVGDKLVSVNHMIFNDVMHDVKHIIDHVDKKLEDKIALVEKSVEIEREERVEADKLLQEAINTESTRAQEVETQIWEALNNESQTREEIDNQQWEAITNEAKTREEVDNQQWEAIANEAKTREEVDNQQWEAIANETKTREEVDNQQWEAITTETQTREEEDKKLYETIEAESQTREEIDNQQWEAIANEAKTREEEDNKLYEALNVESQTREEVDNQQWEAIANEAKTREEIDNQQWEAINTEREERKAKDEEIEGKLLTQEGTEFDTKEGVLTLKSAAGTNDITVQFSFNFGEF